MLTRLRNLTVKALAWPFGDAAKEKLVSWFSRRLLRELRRNRKLADTVTDPLLELLLGAMALAFEVCPSYRAYLKEFRATYIIHVRSSGIGCRVEFARERMEVKSTPRLRPGEQATVTVTFANTGALDSVLLNTRQDILEALLKNEVQVEGNLNYLYKFAFLARDLLRRLGLEPVAATSGAAREPAAQT
jgi:hypothetical protein